MIHVVVLELVVVAELLFLLVIILTYSFQEGDLKKPLKIKYGGGGEQGLDMGGLQKEFFHMIVDSIFESGQQLFSFFCTCLLYPWF